MNTSGMGRQLALVSLFPARKPRTLDQALTHAARQWLGNECVVTEQLSYRYRQIDKWLTSLAAGLITNGIKLGDRVALVMANYAAFVAIEFAIFSVGTIVAPINFLNLRNEMAYVLKQASAPCLLTMNAFCNLNYLGMRDNIRPQCRSEGGTEVLLELKSVFVLSTGETLPPDKMGELRIRGFGVTPGDCTRPIKAADAFDVCGWFRTSNPGTLDEGGYPTFKNRAKESCRCGVERVLLLKFGTVRAANQNVNAVYVAAIPDQPWSEVGVASVIKVNDADVDSQALIDLRKQKLAPFKLPEHILFLLLNVFPPPLPDGLENSCSLSACSADLI